MNLNSPVARRVRNALFIGIFLCVTCTPHGGFWAFVLLPLFACSWLFDLFAMVRRPEQRARRAERVLTWMLAFCVTGAVNLYWFRESRAYANNVVPVARGDGARVVQEAQAYRQQIVLNAQGDAARFLSVYNSYKASEDVTARRLYIETMESILKNTSKIVLDKSAATSGVVPYLPLPQLSTPHPAAAASASPLPAVPMAPAQPPRGTGR